MAILTASDLQARLSADAYSKLFDRDGTGVDPAFVTLCLDEGVSELGMRLKASFPQGLEAGESPVDPRLKGAAAAFVIYAAARYSALATGAEESPYRRLYLDAVAFCDALRKDDGLRPETAAQGTRGLPHAVVHNTADAAGEPTNHFSRTADRKDWSAY